jgi:hypothetical protein
MKNKQYRKVKIRSLGCGFVLLFVVLTGCDSNPEEKPQDSDLIGTWIPVSSSSISSTQYLRLNSDHTFFATNFPISPRLGEVSTDSGSGKWELEQSYAAWRVDVSFTKVGGYQFTVHNRKRPFLLTAPINDDDIGLQAHRVEDLPK